MSRMSIKDALREVLSKGISVDDAISSIDASDVGEFMATLNYMQQKLNKSNTQESLVKFDGNGQWSLVKAPVSEAQRKAMWAAAKGKSDIGIPKDVAQEFTEKDPGGKLPKKLNKAIKPGPTLDYKKINPKPDFKEIEENAPKIDYGDTRIEAPKRYAGAAEKAKAVRSKIEAESKETAMETIARRQKIKKYEGVLVDEEAENKGRMITKNEMLGYGPQGTPENAMTMSEKEPHDDPKHEAKEKKKAQHIKEDAQELLDMHKDI